MCARDVVFLLSIEWMAYPEYCLYFCIVNPGESL